MIIDDHRLSPKSNNLTLVRLLLASAVIWTHSIWRVTGVAEVDQFNSWLGNPISTFAVDGFFFLSGFLVYASLLRRPRARDFAMARLARLWPALAVAVTVTIAGGALLTAASGLSYLQGPTAKFAIYNLSLLYPAFYLTGVNCGGELCNVNGSLWTIPWEVRCYVLLGLLSLIGLARPRVMQWVIFPSTALFAVLMHVGGISGMLKGALGHTVTYYMAGADRLWFMFGLGIACFVWRKRIRLSWWWTLGLLIALIATTRAGIGVPHLAHFFTASLVLNLGFLTARRKAVSGKWPDYSYGMYIYAFPVMMLVAGIVPGLSFTMLALLTTLSTVIPAALSWHLVEKPVLDLVRNRQRGEPQSVPAPATPSESESSRAMA